MKPYLEIERLRNYSSAFSRSVFLNIIDHNDCSRLNYLFDRYDSNREKEWTYLDYLKHMYSKIAEKYRCEYVYKNEIISKLLIEQYGTTDAVAINEFRVRGSIADFALFNGDSKAFEIKTEFDNKKRLDRQIQDYTKLFQKCYIVVPEHLLQQYEECTSKNIGIVALSTTKNSKIVLQTSREATMNKKIDISILMSSIRTEEYKNIVLQYFGKLPVVSCYEMFEKCQKKIKQIPQKELQKLFLNEIKKRKSNTRFLADYSAEIRQMCLSMNLTQKQYANLLEKLNNPITK